METISQEDRHEDTGSQDNGQGKEKADASGSDHANAGNAWRDSDVRHMPLAVRAGLSYLFKDRTMQEVASRKPVAIIIVQWIVRILMHDPSIEILDADAQRPYFTAGGRRIELDLWGTDSRGVLYNIELQRDPSGAEYDRVVAHSGVMRSNSLVEGMELTDGPEVNTFFITERPRFSQEDHPDLKSPIVRMYEVPWNDEGDDPGVVCGKPMRAKERRYYVDSSYEGCDEIGNLMHDLWCCDYRDFRNSTIGTIMRAWLHPEEKEAQEAMDSVLEQRLNKTQAELMNVNGKYLKAEREAAIANDKLKKADEKANKEAERAKKEAERAKKEAERAKKADEKAKKEAERAKKAMEENARLRQLLADHHVSV